MKNFESTCGLPNSGWIYFIGLASFVEALAFTSVHALLISDINRRRSYQISSNNFFAAPLRIAMFLLIISVIRILVAVALVAGRYMKMLSTLAFYIMFTVIGILCNLIAGILAVNEILSYDVGVATIAIIALHIIYVFIAIKIYRMERKTPNNGPVIQSAVLNPAYPPPISIPGSRYVASPPDPNTPEMAVSHLHMPPPLSPPRYSEHAAGSTSYDFESEADPKKTTILK